MFNLFVCWLVFQALLVMALQDVPSEKMCNKIMWIPAPIRWAIFTIPSLAAWANK